MSHTTDLIEDPNAQLVAEAMLAADCQRFSCEVSWAYDPRLHSWLIQHWRSGRERPRPNPEADLHLEVTELAKKTPLQVRTVLTMRLAAEHRLWTQGLSIADWTGEEGDEMRERLRLQELPLPRSLSRPDVNLS